MAAYTTRYSCRLCGGSNLTTFWNAGDMFVVGFPKSLSEHHLSAPLALCVCENCWLVQLLHTVKPELLYSEFFYRSGINEMMRKELASIANSAVAELTDIPYRERWALDIGCNDGTLLNSYPEPSKKLMVHKVGMDPAKNIQNAGVQPEGWFFIPDYFSSDKALQASYGDKYEIITAIAMFYDLDDPLAFIKDIKRALHPDGTFIVQMNYLKSMLETNGIDNVSHEHLTYFSLTTLCQLFKKSGLSIVHAEVNSTNGGSIRIYAKHTGGQFIRPTVINILQAEADARLDSIVPYVKFAMGVQEKCNRLNEWLGALSRSGKKVYVYGASTRGTTLLQLLQTHGKIIAAADRDPNKIGRHMVGSWLPIVTEEEGREDADYFLMLPWHFKEAILLREKEWMAKGGKFIVPLPEPHIHEQIGGTDMTDMSESLGMRL